MSIDFNKKECETIISYSNIYGNIHVSEIDTFMVKSKIDYNIGNVYRDERTQWVFDKISNFLSTDFPDNKVRDIDFFYLQQYSEGMKFTKHIDKTRDKNWYVVTGCTLTDTHVGGKLLAYNPDTEYASNMGEMYWMWADRLHEVTVIEKGVRWSIVLFLTQDDLGMKQKTI
jgi:hypothetical protein